MSQSEEACFENGGAGSSPFNHGKCGPGKNLSFGRRQNPFSVHPQKNKKSKYARKEEESKKRKPNNDAEFRYGNYHQYYGYRNQGATDSRLLCMKKEWFEGRDVLDVGCNAGHFTLSLAKEFLPRSIVGVDIDGALVKMAMRNVRHYFGAQDLPRDAFPLSLVLSYGPLAEALCPRGRGPTEGHFPFNVQFLQCNFVLPEDEMVDWVGEHFDTVLCLSLTKWVHLNWGDAGIRRLFRRCHNHLRPGGHLLLEAQDFRSYAKRKRILPDCLKNYQSIQLYPEMFNEYLLKEVGFETCELVDVPAHSSKGESCFGYDAFSLLPGVACAVL
ncbi:LOW QUALITY PROTEIN: 7SK snRNA methylphosphate capping enzyme-like [Uloborus diversus]|uniref:LOW QUALITY PROTEIN: 7SK snRNA methylphosphate capping enzyme-like n=1 Tax=Uloborus diversus TaxID=327109 RepID=UPI002409E0BA|nr:LOW QUALITY PROTEIN: 7SK snRNA methylphosphate capping enzyme-like [Uloborus diversus]